MIIRTTSLLNLLTPYFFLQAIYRIPDQAGPRQLRARAQVLRKGLSGMGLLPERDRLRQEPQPAGHHLQRRGTQIHQK